MGENKDDLGKKIGYWDLRDKYYWREKLIYEFEQQHLPPQMELAENHSLATIYSAIKRIWYKDFKKYTDWTTNEFIRYLIDKYKKKY